jgi:hypothetical protein
VEVDDAFGLGGEVGEERTVGGAIGGGEAFDGGFAEERCEGGSAEEVAAALEKAAAGLMAVEFFEETHGVQAVIC